MRYIVVIALAAFPCLAEDDDGDWEYLKRNVPDEKSMLGTVRNEEKTNTFRFLPTALKFIEEANAITVFEGLPHQNFESELLAKELERTEETRIEKFPFYPEPQVLRKEDEPSLRKLLIVPDDLSPFLYLKMCGGFHPDYAIRFTRGEEHCDLLLCFGCGDGMILHNDKVIHCHISGKGWEKLLAPYAKLRPKGG